MSDVQRTLAAALVGGLLPLDALAHSSVPGIEGFSTGLLHPISTIEQVLALLALGMMLGLRWPDWLEVSFLAFASSMLLGIFFGQLGIAPGIGESVLLLIAVFAATLCALYPRGLLALFVILPSITGALIGVLSTPDPGSLTATIVTLFGSFLGANFALFYVSVGVFWFRDRFKGQWAQIGLRIVAAWIATISVLMASLTFVEQRVAALPMRTNSENGALQVYVVNYPLAYFSERIAGDLAEVTFPAPPGVDPAFWMPDSETTVAYQSADLILLNGADYAEWTKVVSLPRSRLVDTSRAFKDDFIHESNGVIHSHGPGIEHEHGGVASTTWLDLDQASQQSEAIAQALTRMRPDAKLQIDRNLKSLQQELLALDEEFASISQMDPGRRLLASHAVYQYLARRYGLNLRSVMWEPEEVPSESEWAALEDILREHPTKWMLWVGEPAQESVERLRELGVESVVVNPSGNRPSAGDFLTVMEENAMNLGRVFSQLSGGSQAVQY